MNRTPLSDGVVVLRPFSAEDVAVYVARQDDEMRRWFDWPAALSFESMTAMAERWQRSWQTRGPERNFAILDASTGEVIGDCEAELRTDGLVNITYVVFPEWRRRGVATRATRLLLADTAEAFDGHAAILRIDEGNAASKAVARRLGAAFDGTEATAAGRVLERWIVPAAQTDHSPATVGRPARRVSIRPFSLADRQALLAGRDHEMERWLGPGSSTPSPTVVIEVDGAVIGWVDAGTEPEWLGAGEVNLGYAVFAEHRGHGNAAGAVRLLLDTISTGQVRRAVFVIDRRNHASLRVAAAVGARQIEHPATALYPTSDVYAVDLAEPTVTGR